MPFASRPALPSSELSGGLPAPVTVERLVWCFTGLGVLLRLARYLLEFPLWCDEYQLAANFLDADFADLLRPLHHNQVAPVGFLWIELAAVRLFGFSELSLRLFPALCAVISVFLFRYVAQRLLSGLALVFAVAIFAVAYYPIRHGAEVKPYASDLCLSLLLLTIALPWFQAGDDLRHDGAAGRRSARPLWILALVSPLALSVSFTAAFIAGGLSLGILWSLWKSRGTAQTPASPISPPAIGTGNEPEASEGSAGDSSIRGLAPPARHASATCRRANFFAWGAFNLAVGVAFLSLMRLNVAAQYDATRNEMTACWADGFPPWRNPLQLAVWLIDVHTGAMFAYPVGAEHGGSILTFALFLMGLFEWHRQGRQELLVTIAGWFALSLVAAAMHRYPYGSHARLSQYLAPAICLVAGSGGAAVVGTIRRPYWQTVAVRTSVGAGIVLGVGFLVRDFAHPYKTSLDRQHRDFARRFWPEHPEALTVCLQTDLGLRIYDGNFETPYLCHQRIYSPAHRHGGRAVAEQIAAEGRPLRCVLFHSASARRNEAVYSDWMEKTLAHYDLVRTESFRWPLSNNRDDLYDFYTLCYDVYYFVPRRRGESTPPAEQSAKNAGPADRQ